MELIIDNSKHVENDFRFATAVDPNKCLNLSYDGGVYRPWL